MTTTDEYMITAAKEINDLIIQVNKANDDMMNTFDDLRDSIKKHLDQFKEQFTSLETRLNTALAENQEHKSEADNFNRVSMVKKQDIQIRQDQIKIAELESRIRFLEKELESRNRLLEKDNTRLSSQAPTSPAQPESTPANEIEDNENGDNKIQCNARVGKKKFKISKQHVDFMNRYPDNTYVSESGCVIGSECKNTIDPSHVFCKEHSNGKFEDIRKPPADESASEQATSASEPTTSPASSKSATKVAKAKPSKKTADASPTNVDEPPTPIAANTEEHQTEVTKTEEPIVAKARSPSPEKKALESPTKARSPSPPKTQENNVSGRHPDIQIVEAGPSKVPNFDSDTIEVHTFADGTSCYINIETNELFEITDNDDIGIFIGKLSKN